MAVEVSELELIIQADCPSSNEIAANYQLLRQVQQLMRQTGQDGGVPQDGTLTEIGSPPSNILQFRPRRYT